MVFSADKGPPNILLTGLFCRVRLIFLEGLLLNYRVSSLKKLVPLAFANPE